MKKITPYKTGRNALAALDNGGRFYNLASRANDGQVTTAELKKAAGVFSGEQKMVLFLEMSLAELTDSEKSQVTSAMTQDVRSAYQKYAPQHLLPSEARRKAEPSSSAIITGIPRLIESVSEFKGFIMIPIITNNVTTFSMIPIMDQYDVYRLYDHEQSRHFLIAHSRSSKKLPESMIRCGGVFKELKAEPQDKADGDIFLESLYYSVL